MRRLVAIVIITLLGVFFVLGGMDRAHSAGLENGSGYLNLDQDPFVPGGLTADQVQSQLLPVFGQLSGKPSDECLQVEFNCDLPKVVAQYRDPSGRIYSLSGSLKAFTPVIATIDKKVRIGNDWQAWCTVRWLHACGNPFKYPFRIIVTYPAEQTQIVIKSVYIVKEDVTRVDHNVIVQQLVPRADTVNITVPPATEQARYGLEVTSHETATERWEYHPSWWDKFVQVLSIIACPLGQIFRRADVMNVTANGGVGAAAAAAAASSSTDTSSTSTTPTSAVGASGGSSNGSSGSAAAGGGPSDSGSD